MKATNVLAAAVTASIVAATPAAAGSDSVTEWIDRNAAELSADPAGPLGDLRPLGRMVAGAQVVGLGESTHGSREQFRVKHRMIRYLVEQRGFRTVAFETDFAGGVEMDRYVVTGRGDARALVRDMSSPMWATEEVLELLEWMRSYNRTHRSKVRFLGTDVLTLRETSFDAVSAYVRAVAPERLDDLERDLALVRPTKPRYEHMAWYFGLSDDEKQRLIDAASRASAHVSSLPADASLAREYAEQHARAIHGWYVNYSTDGMRPERERFIADSIGWWQRVHAGRVAYWAASAHTNAAPTMTFRMPGESYTQTWAGGYLRQRLGRRYVSIGVLFHHGSITSDFTTGFGAHPVSPPPAGLVDHTLGIAEHDDYYLSLRSPAPAVVRAWRDGSATLRMIHPRYNEDDDGSGYTMSVPSLREAFDVLVQVRVTTPTRLLR